jgi:hypothetical protein
MQQLSGSAGCGGIGTPPTIFQVDSGGIVSGLYRVDWPGPARRLPKTIDILSSLALRSATEIPFGFGVGVEPRVVDFKFLVARARRVRGYFVDRSSK